MPISIDVVDVADWTGLNVDVAEAALLAQGITVLRVNVLEPTVLVGTVISQVTEATQFGTTVTLTVSEPRFVPSITPRRTRRRPYLA